MMARLQDLHRSNKRSQRYELIRKFFHSRMSEGMSVESHVAQMIADIDELATMGIVFEAEITIDMVL